MTTDRTKAKLGRLGLGYRFGTGSFMESAKACAPVAPKNYGTNSRTAYTDPCDVTAKPHRWESTRVGRCLYDCRCKDCGARTSNDSSD